MPRIYLDESKVERWGMPVDGGERRRIGNRLLVGAVVVPDGGGLETELDQRAREVLADSLLWEFRAGGRIDRRELFEREHFHFKNDDEDIRQRALSVMLRYDIRAHVAYSHLGMTSYGLSESDIQAAMYFSLVRSLLLRYAGTEVELVFENADAAVEGRYGPLVLHAALSLDRETRKKRRQPRAVPMARIGHKPNGGLSTVDYCLGVANLGLLAKLGDGKTPGLRSFERSSAARLERHLAHVVDFDAAAHGNQFDMLWLPSRARHMRGAISHSTVSTPVVTPITRGPAGSMQTSLGVDSALDDTAEVTDVDLFRYQRDAATLAGALGMEAAALAQARALARDASAYKFPTVLIRGKRRHLVVPVDQLLVMTHRRLLEFLRPLNDGLHPRCVAYMPGARPADAAAPHAGREWIQKLDIKDFFATTSTQLVADSFERVGATSEVAGILADLTTYKNSLPTGVRTSPLISNLVLTGLDETIAAEAAANGLEYTRYADDLIFSGDDRFSMEQAVREGLAGLGYELNPAKTVLRRRGQFVRVAGLSVFEDGRPGLTKPIKRRLRREMFVLEKKLSAEPLDEMDDEYSMSADTLWQIRHTRGLVRYCMSIDALWTAKQVATYPLARAEVEHVSATPEQRTESVGRLVERISVTDAPRLTTTNQIIGPPPPLDAAEEPQATETEYLDLRSPSSY